MVLTKPWIRRAARTLLVLVALLVAYAAAAQSKPSASAYLGKWGTIESRTGSVDCQVDVSRVGQSFAIKNESQAIGNCLAYEGIWTYTPEGNLRKEGMGQALVIAYDESTGRALVSGLGAIRYLMHAAAARSIEQNDRNALKSVRYALAAQAAYPSLSGVWGRWECLSNPHRCESSLEEDPKISFLSPGTALADLLPEGGYTPTFIPGQPKMGRRGTMGVATFVYAQTPLVVGRTGIRGFAGDSAGRICFTTDGTIPPIVNGELSPSCNVLR